MDGFHEAQHIGHQGKWASLTDHEAQKQELR
ncbi:hypothetical protein SAMN05443253_106290 [Bacillus sp. OK048]|nr:hypothetical protein SAMN05443253_106290 [Bacillus sp. OK048]